MPCLYALSSDRPDSGIRYVGVTRKEDPTSRLQGHLRAAQKGSKCHVHNWIRKELHDGFTVSTNTLQEHDDYANAQSAEITTIAQLKSAGISLTNMTTGGEGILGLVHSAETRKNMSAAWKKRPPHSDETRQKMSASQKKRPPTSAETRKKMSEAQKKQPPFSDDHRKKMSASAKKKPPCSNETRKNMSAAQKKRPPPSAETRKKLSDAGKKRPPFSDEHRRNV